jgi:putative endonuclease
VGVTNSLAYRVWQHKEGVASAFTRKYRVNRLVYYERYGEIADAISREKKLKRWRREWKVALIEAGNPQWLDLYETLNQ